MVLDCVYLTAWFSKIRLEFCGEKTSTISKNTISIFFWWKSLKWCFSYCTTPYHTRYKDSKNNFQFLFCKNHWTGVFAYCTTPSPHLPQYNKQKHQLHFLQVKMTETVFLLIVPHLPLPVQ
jgi:hypothetical protein